MFHLKVGGQVLGFKIRSTSEGDQSDQGMQYKFSSFFNFLKERSF